MADSSTTAQKVSAEVIGTFVLVFFGCGTAVVSGSDYVATGLAFGLAVLVGAYAFGRVSGAHFNPAVSVGAALGGRMAWRQVPVYVASQLVGGLAAGLVLFVLLHGFRDYDITGHMGQNGFGDHGPVSGVHFAWWAAFLLELLMTAIFVWVILAVTDARNEHPALAPAAIGLALTMVYFASLNATGASVNPARSIGVGVFAGSDAIVQLWLFILAPLVGGAVAGATYPLLFGHDHEPVPGSGLAFRSQEAAVPGYGMPDQFQQEWHQQGLAADAAAEQAWATEPIIQDGWQWDHQAQEWRPLEQWQPAAPVDQSVEPVGASVDPSVGASVDPSVGASVDPSVGASVDPSHGAGSYPTGSSVEPPAVDDTQVAAPPVTDPASYRRPDQQPPG